jgi:hypothetical protein
MRNPNPRLPKRVLAAPLAVLAALALAAPLAQPALASTAVHFQRESYAAFLAQLAHGEVHAVVLHPQGYKAHISLDNGSHFTATYPPSEVAKLEGQAQAKGASFTLAKATHKSAGTHHKLRYIAGGILIVVILVVLVVLLVGRRRALTEDETRPREGDAASAP